MRVWILCTALIALLASGFVGYYVVRQYAPPPAIQGAYLQPARKLGNFQLADHHNENFGRQHLMGRWHLVSYGFTHCPDICPLTLARLAQLKQTLERDNVYPEVQVLFYSVDSERDTPEQLALYTAYFHPEFIGLTRAPGNSGYRNFERGLGILAESSLERDSVNHGVMLMLLNPEAQLQAVFKPERNEHGLYHFTEKKLYEDYRAVRDYYAQKHEY